MLLYFVGIDKMLRKIGLAPWQSDALRARALRLLRFPEEYYRAEFGGDMTEVLLLGDHLDEEEFSCCVVGEETLGEGRRTSEEIREGFWYCDSSYEEAWNERFPNQPYRDDLPTVVVRLNWAI